jgi:purine-binding chemotaxis protein CheW
MPMNNDKKTGATLVDQQDAINAYLDSLLAEATEPVVEAQAETRESVVVALHPSLEEPQPVSEVSVAQETATGAEETVAEFVSEVPEWAGQRFQCLVFTVHGLKLAVPLEGLNGILTWSEDILSMPGHAPHFLGLLKTQEATVKVVDPALLVMPEGRTPPAIGQEGRETPGNIILIGRKRWGLAADSVSETMTLNPDEVRWRTVRGKRKWLAGTVIEHMCALLDVEEFARILESSDSID